MALAGSAGSGARAAPHPQGRTMDDDDIRPAAECTTTTGADSGSAAATRVSGPLPPAARSAPLPPSVNYHLWAPCNMRCRFCFAPFQDVVAVLPAGHLAREDSLRLVHTLAGRFEKITFAGG